MIALGKVVSLFAGLLLLAGYTAAAFAAETSKDEAAIRAINPAWVKAYNAGDAKAISGLYAEQAVLLPPGAPAAKGNAAIQAYLAKDMAESAKAGFTFSLDVKTDVGTSGDLGWESGTYAVKAKSGASVEIGKYLTVFKKSDGKWLIIRDTWNSDASTPPPAIPAKK
ncbi:MAG: SgcJ/EcaC family oxidoreductase [Betaproteobacteria bacterium]|nr:MAG: SgcJ/EcaC family oxidoreductase [Betaproteobacteria bacterium]